jgi:pimeloyl-ACP methyl ester carboxylesterase
MSSQGDLTGLLERSRKTGTPCDHGEISWRHWQGAPGRPPLVLLHGGYGSWTHWVRNIEGLSLTRDVWVPDLPGLGDSADMPEPRTPDHMAQLLLHGIDSLLGGTSHFDLAGFSFGAIVGASLAARSGSRCEHLVVCGGAGWGSLHVQVELMRPPEPGTEPDEARSIHHANLRALMFASDETIDELALQCHADNLARARFNSRRLSLTSGFIDTLPKVRAHVAGIWGSRDATAGGGRRIQERRRLLREVQPEAGFHVLNGIGHWAMYEAPNRFNEALLAELDR